MRLPFPALGKPTVFLLLMLLSAATALLPPGWTSWAGAVLQPIGWLQQGLTFGGQTVLSIGRGVSLPPNEAQRLVARAEQLERQVAHQALQIADLETRLATVSGVQQQLAGSGARVIVAPLVALDSTRTREMVTIGRGSRAGIKLGDWVAAGVPEELRADSAAGRELLEQQWVVGRVSEVFPYLSRVQLMTDAGFGAVRARVARTLADGTTQRSDERCVLNGAGSGRMEIRQATQNYLSQQLTQVYVELRGAPLAELFAGTIVAAKTVDQSALHFDLEVRPAGRVDMLSTVYVVSLP